MCLAQNVAFEISTRALVVLRTSGTKIYPDVFPSSGEKVFFLFLQDRNNFRNGMFVHGKIEQVFLVFVWFLKYNQFNEYVWFAEKLIVLKQFDNVLINYY